MSYDPKIFNKAPYYDDFNEDKKFLRMLFRPGYAIQARELTQAQTILQNQIQRMGDHVFENGTKVIGADIAVQNANFIRFEKTNITSGADWVGKIITSGNYKAKVLAVDDPYGTSDDYYVFIVQTLSGDVPFFGSSFNDGITDIFSINPSAAQPDHSGVAKILTINEGIFYVDGFFVKNNRQTTSPASVVNGQRNYTTATSEVGFLISKSTVSSNTDPTLRDPANGSYNYNAPGADRFKIDLVLIKDIDTNYDSENFISVGSFTDGKLTRRTLYTDYAALEDALARRTYDESGSYIVRPYEISIKENTAILGDNGDSSKLSIALGAGKAYVYGYEFETQSSTFLTIDKARGDSHTKSISNAELTNFDIGTFILGTGSGVSNYTANTQPHGFANFLANIYGLNTTGQSSTRVRLYGLVDGSYINCGSATVYNVVSNFPETGNSNEHRFYLVDIRNDVIDATAPQGSTNQATIMVVASDNDLQSFTDLSTVADRLVADIIPSSNGDIIRSRSKSPNLVFELPVGSLASNISSVEYQKTGLYQLPVLYSRVNDTTNQITLRLSKPSEKFAGASTTDGFTTLSDQFVKRFFKLYFSHETNWDAATNVTSTNEVDISSANGWSLLLSNGGKTLTVRGPSSVFAQPNEFILHATVEVDHNPTSIETEGFFAGTVGAGLVDIRTKTLTTTTSEFISIPVLDADTGTYYFEIPNADVFDILSVKLIEGQVETNIVDDFVFDNGQRDTHYDYGRLYIKPNSLSKYIDFNDNDEIVSVYTENGGLVSVNYTHFVHSGSGPVVVNSYSGIDFDRIPVFTSPSTGKTVQLANCIDFRGVRNADGIVEDFIKVRNQPSVQNDIIRSSYDFYVGRIDKVVLTKRFSNENTTFEVITGSPDLNPVAPADKENSITLYQLTIPPYTFNAEDVRIRKIENRRFTMQDIGKLESRLDDVEYFAVLSDLEKDTLSRTILVQTDANGTETEGYKNAILVDTFRGHAIGDVGNSDYRCSIDFETGTCRPSFISNHFDLQLRRNISGITIDSNHILRPTVTETPFIESTVASTTININPFFLTNWIGTVDLDPYGDTWFDVDYRPSIKINTLGESDAWKSVNYTTPNAGRGFGSQWNDWQSIWHGVEYTETDDSDSAIQNALTQPNTKTVESIIQKRYEEDSQSVSRETKTLTERKNLASVRIRNIPDRIKKIVQNRIIDISVVPYMRSKDITVSADGLKPNATVHCFFDGINVNEHCTDTNGLTGPFVVGLSGDIRGITFSIPEGTFECGEKVFRFIDDENNDVDFSETSADGVFFAQGKKRRSDRGSISIRPPVLRRQTTSSERIVRDTFTRERSLNTRDNTQFMDPLAQTFIVSSSDTPFGMYINSVELYFKSKSSNNLPVTVQIRPTVNGTPHASEILPFSEVTMYPEDVVLNTDATGPVASTKFSFETPVFLEPGEYAICLIANTDEYEVFAGQMGEVDIITSNYINKDPYNGTLFEPQNGSLSVPIRNKDLMFKINQAVPNIVDSASVVLENKAKVESADGQVLFLNTSDFIPTGTNIIYEYGSSSIVSGKNITLPSTVSVRENTNTLAFTCNLSVSNNVFPMIDVSQSNAVLIDNHINFDFSGETDPSRGNAACKYISRRIVLSGDGNTDQIQAILSINKPVESCDIKVYVKAQQNGEVIPFDDLPYVELENFVPSNIGGDSLDTYTSRTKEEYKDFYFRIPFGSNDYTDIRSFAIKVVLLSNDDTNIPTVRNLRTIALTTP